MGTIYTSWGTATERCQLALVVGWLYPCNLSGRVLNLLIFMCEANKANVANDVYLLQSLYLLQLYANDVN